MGNLLGMGPAPQLGNVAVERESFFGRMGNALCGVCFGLVIFVASIFLLGWNEFNYVRNQAVLLKVQKEVVEVGCQSSNANIGSPIWASCIVDQVANFQDDPSFAPLNQFGFSEAVQGAWFKASSQIYQWVEEKDCESHTTTGGGKEKICTYSYSQEWVSSPVSSSSFYCYPTFKSGCHQSGDQIKNQGSIPSVLQMTISAQDGQIAMGNAGADYSLNSAMLGIFPSSPVTVNKVPMSFSPLPAKKVLLAGTGSVKFVDVSSQDSIGDVRTTFSQSAIVVGQSKVSIIAKQGPITSGHARLQNWDTKLSGTMSQVNWAAPGYESKDDMIADKDSENGSMVVLLRFVGYFVMVLGLQLVTGPISLMPEVVPCCGEQLGSVVGCALCCINSMVSLALSLTVIGIAWILARPLLGLGLLAAAAAAVAGAWAVRNKFGKSSARSIITDPLVAGSQAVQPVLAQPVAAQSMQMQVICPDGAVAGQTVVVQAQGRQYSVQVPPGVQPGQAFTIQV